MVFESSSELELLPSPPCGPCGPCGRSRAVAAGWGFLALVKIETLAKPNALSGPECPTLPRESFDFHGKTKAQKLHDLTRRVGLTSPEGNAGRFGR